MKLDGIILDADVCIKLGKITSGRFIELVIPLISDTIFIHPSVKDEVKWPEHAISQIDTMLRDGKIELLDDKLWNPFDSMVYSQTVEILKRTMVDPRKTDHHMGEVYSLAAAKTKGIDYLLSDEKKLQRKVDALLNTGIDKGNIRCITLVDVLNMFADGTLSGIDRETAKTIWLGCLEDTLEFDRIIWP